MDTTSNRQAEVTDLETQISVLRINLATVERRGAELENALGSLVAAVREQNSRAARLGDCVVKELLQAVAVLEGRADRPATTGGAS